MNCRTRPFTLPVALLMAGLLAACGNSPEKLNRQIDSGNASAALTKIEEKLAANPTSPALSLLAAKARLALCVERNCTSQSSSTLPPLLAPVEGLLARVTAPVPVGKDVSPLTVTAVVNNAMAAFQRLDNQPAAVLTLYGSVPPGMRPGIMSGLFQPALATARKGQYRQAGQILAGLGQAKEVPTIPLQTANMLSGLLTNQPMLAQSNLIALRSAPATQPLPANAAALLPWAVLARTAVSQTAYPAQTALENMPATLRNWQAPVFNTTTTQADVAAELATIAQTPELLAQWQSGYPSGTTPLPLAVQRLSLSFNPNQPQLWSVYLPQLIQAASSQSGSVAGLELINIPSSGLTSTTAQQLAGQLIKAAGQLTNQPATAAPLITLAARIGASKQQQVDLEKLAQDLLLKATEQSDVTSTLILAQAIPGVAQNNRQSVVPLLVKQIRANLRDGNFDAATATADLLTETLKMDLEFGPIILQEFADDLKRRRIAQELTAETPGQLTQPSSTVQLSLGPIFTFMQTQFATQPDILTAQLTTLIAEAHGAYGQPTAMYRLGHLFPESTMPLSKQQEWLAASLSEALLDDTTLNGPALADTAARLAVYHPALNLAPLMDAALKRTGTLEEQRELWRNATPQTRAVLKAIRPEFSALMRGVDALESHGLNTAAKEFADLTDPVWRNQAKPFLEQFQSRLIALAGTYVPVSGNAGLKIAAVTLAPSGLIGGPLGNVSVTFISRVGTLTESEPAALRTNAAAVHRFELGLPVDFDHLTLSLTQQVLAQTPSAGAFLSNFGNVRKLTVLPGSAQSQSLLSLTLADGTVVPFVRALVNPSMPLRPDGTYLIQTRLSPAVSDTSTILPPGSVLTLATVNAMRRPAETDDTAASLVFPLTGTLRHPSSGRTLQFEGFFEPNTLTSTFTFSYPLPQSAQPVRATVRCQALAGPITCGGHHVHSPRQAYAALVTGLQTRESLLSTSAQRADINSIEQQGILVAAASAMAKAIPAISPTQPASASTISATMLTSITTPVSATIAISPATPTPAPSATIAPAPQAADTAEEHADEEEAEPAPRPSLPVSSSPTGVFIHHVYTPPSPTTR